MDENKGLGQPTEHIEGQETGFPAPHCDLGRKATETAPVAEEPKVADE